MTTAQVVETSVTVNNNSPIQDYVHPDDQTQPFEITPGFKPFTVLKSKERLTEVILFSGDQRLFSSPELRSFGQRHGSIHGEEKGLTPFWSSGLVVLFGNFKNKPGGENGANT